MQVLFGGTGVLLPIQIPSYCKYTYVWPATLMLCAARLLSFAATLRTMEIAAFRGRIGGM